MDVCGLLLPDAKEQCNKGLAWFRQAVKSGDLEKTLEQAYANYEKISENIGALQKIADATAQIKNISDELKKLSDSASDLKDLTQIAAKIKKAPDQIKTTMYVAGGLVGFIILLLFIIIILIFSKCHKVKAYYADFK